MWFIKCKAIYYLLEIAMKIRMGSSHQNVKQILLKLEKKGFVSVTVDESEDS